MLSDAPPNLWVGHTQSIECWQLKLTFQPDINEEWL